MKSPLWLFLIGTALTTGCAEPPAPVNVAEAVADPLEGAWRIIERKLGGTNGILNTSPQPGMRIFADGHSCNVRVDGAEPRPVRPDSTATPAELTAVWGSFSSACGTYEIVDGNLVEHVIVAKSPSGMDGDDVNTATYRFSGDTLWVSTIANVDGPVAIPGYTKFMRMR